MAKNVTVQGASYTGVPAIDVPQTGGGTARFIDPSDTTATASDVASGKYFYAADGVKTLGTASGGGGQAEGFLEAMLADSADLQNYTEIPGNPTAITLNSFYGKENLRLTALPDSVTAIGDYAFFGCASMPLASLPANLTSIGQYAFFSCSALDISAIPQGVTRIEDYSFMWARMGDLTIPASVTYIGTSAFYDAYGATAYHLKPTTPPTLASTDAFYAIPANCKIYVPTGCLSAYQSASNWSSFASYMEEE